ncbi:MAG TPA: hypothetical protein DCX75_12255 [Brevundimonas sp.]|jgi:hypothetical protein|uniref:PEGA domain-containing protein n=2 Tax=unclassified Brevundimonas TaxID=2622653 RepID=UPI000E8DAE34|nr:PEGA domain-containing protein [Brevundimonas sp.]HAJ04482.1 hypothetical protein [Brevundimonas sp.]HAV50825.1 hypothetical protein [Brevundimonas sp.]|tara:strand:+ start:224 stop:520 length:297 start_codon:yes stop_codon:yes gene_type:complete
MPNRAILAAFACMAVSGCVQNYAEREVTQGAALGSLVVLNAPEGATIKVDGRPYDTTGSGAAALSPGRHEVVVEVNGRPIHSQAIFIAAGARVEVRVP